MNNGFKCEFSINGAKLYPTDEQYAKIIDFVANVILGKSKEPEVKPKKFFDAVRRVKRKQEKRHIWTSEERAYITNMTLEGLTNKQIVKGLYNIYGVSITPQAVYMQVAGLKSKQQADPGEVKPQQIASPLRANEFDGTEELKAHVIG